MRRTKSFFAFAVVVLCFSLLRAENLYTLYENRISNEKSYSNPFTDTELQLTITAPGAKTFVDGRSRPKTFAFQGFYDGDGNGGQDGNVWKYRIFLDMPGTWTVEWEFSDGLAGTDEIDVASQAGGKGFIRQDPDNKRFFLYDNGDHYWPRSGYSGRMLGGEGGLNTHSDEEFRAAIDKWASKSWGITQITSHIPNKTTNNRTFWLNNNDFSRFDITAWTRVDKILKHGYEKGVYFDIWWCMSNINGQYNIIGPAGDTENENLYIKYWNARIGVNPAMVWVGITSEYQEADNGGSRTKNWASRMDASNPWKTMLTTHTLNEPLCASEFQLGLSQFRSRETDLNSEVNDAFGRCGYHINVTESVWEHGHLGDNHDRTRVSMWSCLMAGGSVQMRPSWSGKGDDWFFNIDPDDEMDQTAYGYTEYMWDALESIPGWWNMVPSNGKISGARAFALAELGENYFVYLPDGGDADIDLTGASGTFTVDRIDPRTGDRENGVTTLEGGGTRKLPSTPSSGSRNDWAYIVRGEGSSNLVVSTAGLPTGYVNTPYTATLEANNAVGEVQWSITSGSLPAGLTLTGGTISGTPAAEQTSQITVTADDGSSSVEAQFTIEIRAEKDDTGPVVSDVEVFDITNESATVTWTTNELSDSRVQWGDGPQNLTGESGVVESNRTEHSVTIGPFGGASLVHILIITVDNAENQTIHRDSFSVSTESVRNIDLLGVEGAGVTIVTRNDRERSLVLSLSEPSRVSIGLYDISGKQLMRVPGRKALPRGKHVIGLNHLPVGNVQMIMRIAVNGRRRTILVPPMSRE